MFHLDFKIKSLVRIAIREDVGSGDITTHALIPKTLRARGVIVAKSRGILAGQAAASEVFRAVDPSLKLKWRKKDGAVLKSGGTVCLVSGRAASILKAERVALNFLSHLSGVASLTHEFVQKIKGTKAKIYDTRKTIPLWRSLEKYAVRAGGGTNHRIGLWDQGFVKDNHWELIQDAGKIARTIQKSKAKRWIVEISKNNLGALETILKGKPGVILLDNFSSIELEGIVKSIRRRSKNVLIEASGGIRLQNVRQIAKTGVDRISIGAITHSVPAIDFSLEIQKPVR